MQRAICHESVEQARRFQKIDEERQLPKRSQRRLGIPFDANWAGETVEPHAFRRTLLFNRRLLTRRVKADKRNIVHHDPDNVAIRGKFKPANCRLWVYRDLPPEERAQAVFFAPNYGEAAALDIYGPALSGPPVISAHNSYFLWGPRGASGDVVITLGRDGAGFERDYGDVRAVGRIDSTYAMPYETGLTIWILRQPRAPVAEIWSALKHYETIAEPASAASPWRSR